MRTFVRFGVAFGALLSGLILGSAQAQVVKLVDQPADKSISIQIGAQEFAQYLMKPNQPKPYMFPVRGADGTVLTRPIQQRAPGQGDHPHHKGIWVAIDEVDGIKFWAEAGKIVTRSSKVLVAEGNPATFQVVNDWNASDGRTVVTESTTISVFANRLLSYDIRFTTTADHPIEFGDTKEGLFGFRMVDSMREKQGGKVQNADGLKTTAECWGKTSDWVDYVGTVEGKTFGVAIFDHPKNLRPSRYHVRDYGLFSVSPFGEKSYTNNKRPAEPYYLQSGSTLRLRYGLYIHSGDTEAGNVNEAYVGYLKKS